MSSTSAPLTQGGGPVTQTSSLAPNQELQISASYKEGTGHLNQGTCYRFPEPLTIKFRSEAGVSPITDVSRQKEVAFAIWTRLTSLIPNATDALEVPLGIVFDQETVFPDSFAVIELVCATVESCNAVQMELREIHVMDQYERTSTFKQHSWFSSVPPNILPFDIYEWFVRPGEVGKLVTQLEQMAAPLGSLVGTVRFMLTTRQPKEPGKFYKVLRGNILLSASSLQLSREEIMHRQTAMFEGMNAIWYSECHLAYYKDWALRFPDIAARHEGREEDVNTVNEARNNADTSASSTSKKRKSNS